MQTSQLGDRVQVHYVKRFQDGSVRSSRERGDAPLELIVGARHPRLPGVGSELVGLTPGKTVTVAVPAERAYGLTDPARVRRVARDRFRDDDVLVAGRRVRMRGAHGRPRVVRIVEVRGRVVVVDTNHPRSGQSVELDVELVSILTAAPELGHWGP
ncbi:MAG: peptidylprolyl isomerase [Gemmataceae bacterium]|nr:peptidylprolyl isomerase [Gemmataceae bacterium]